jgi:hypothetical protein
MTVHYCDICKGTNRVTSHWDIPAVDDICEPCAQKLHEYITKLMKEVKN